MGRQGAHNGVRQLPSRRMGYLLALLAASLTLSGLACAPAQPPTVSPLTCVEFEFCVRDAETGQPIEGASVRLFDTNDAHPRWPDGLEAHTKPAGNYKLASECFTDNGVILYPDWTFTVTAPGYQSLGPVRMTDYTGASGAETYKRIVVGLRPSKHLRPITLPRLRGRFIATSPEFWNAYVNTP